MKFIKLIVNTDPEKFEMDVNKVLSEVQAPNSFKELVGVEYKPLMSDKILCHMAVITYKTIS